MQVVDAKNDCSLYHEYSVKIIFHKSTRAKVFGKYTRTFVFVSYEYA